MGYLTQVTANWVFIAMGGLSLYYADASAYPLCLMGFAILAKLIDLESSLKELGLPQVRTQETK